MKVFLSFVLLLVFQQLVWGQSVGLVLSGGGGPGIAHIGVIKALEENDIPIDYIAATSIGAIVGGMYAVGMSPDEMIRMLKSKGFSNLTSGETNIKDKYSYFNNVDKAGMFRFDIANAQLKLPVSLLSPHEMNWALFSLFVVPTARCANNFNQLLVPFRTVAADVYNKKPVVFSSGQLSSAIRSSMSFPFVFKPAEHNGNVLFDGGIYNNFPNDVMANEFAPDYTIGSVVAYNPSKADKNDFWGQLQNMIIAPTSYQLQNDSGLLLNFDLKEFGTFDFTQVDKLVQIGYDSIISHLDEIKSKVSRRVSVTEMAQRRAVLKNNSSALVVDRISFSGVTESEMNYFQTFIGSKSIFNSADIRTIYYQLTSNEAISEVIPQAIYDSSTKSYSINFDIDIHKPLKLVVGANLSTTPANQLNIGIDYQKLSRWSTHVRMDATLGSIYSGVGFGTRIEIPAAVRSFVHFNAVAHRFNYMQFARLNPSNLLFTLNEKYAKFEYGIGIMSKAKLTIGYGLGMCDFKYNTEYHSTITDYLDSGSDFTLNKFYVALQNNTLNNPQYPTKGYKYIYSYSLFNGMEKSYFANGEKKEAPLFPAMQFKLEDERYFTVSQKLSFGTLFCLTLSDRKALSNSTISVLMEPKFQPTPVSKTFNNSNFSSNKFVAFGFKPIYMLTAQMHVRVEAYGFLPFKGFDSKIGFNAAKYLSELALVYNFNAMSAALFLDCVGTNKPDFLIGINLGLPVFNAQFSD